MSSSHLAVASALALAALGGSPRAIPAQPGHGQRIASGNAPTTPAPSTVTAVRFGRVRLSTGMFLNVAEAGDPVGAAR